MKNKLTAIFASAILLSIFTVQAFASNPDFSGTWTLDKSKSAGLPAGMDQIMTIKQTGDKISLETKLITDDGEQIVPDLYVLDDKEAEFTPKTQNGASAKGKRRAKWTSDGIEVIESATFDTPDGAVTTKVTRKWTISADAKTLQIELNIESPKGAQNIKRIFNKQ